ncbi:MAG TPA: hypothetical protein VKU36_01095 [Candidatus Babeliales bacterium]|nr:hypothetical protein [Candidatus Babeliales bacterium]
MKKLYICLISLFSLIITYNQCMETNNLYNSLISYDRQQRIPLTLHDGTFSLEKWKIYELNTVHDEYLKNKDACDKGQALSLPHITINEISLVSTALNKEPGKEFHHYIKSLSSPEIHTLIVAAGTYDEDYKQKKLDAPGLTAQLVEAYIPLDIQNAYIKPYVERNDWEDFCRSKVINNNFSSSSFPSVVANFSRPSNTILRYDDGSLRTVPCDLIQDPHSYAGFKDKPYLVRVENTGLLTYASKIIDQSYEYCITATNLNGDPGNHCFFWLINHTTGKSQETIINHKNEFKDAIFSSAGDYVATWSNADIIVSKITKHGDDTITLTPCITHDANKINSCCFNKQSTALALADDDGNLIAWDISGNCCKQVLSRQFPWVRSVRFNSDGTRLLAILRENAQDDTDKIIILDTTDLHTIENSNAASLKRKDQALFLSPTCSPNGKVWAIPTSHAWIEFIFIEDDHFEVLSAKNVLSWTDENSLPTIRIVYSPDSRFAAVVFPSADKRGLEARIHNLTTRELITSALLLGDDTFIGTGFIAEGRKLVAIANDSVSSKRTLLHKSDIEKLMHLYNQTSLHQLCVLRRLYRACNNNNEIQLYEESPAYKVLQQLPNKPHDLQTFVKKYLPTQVIHNNKEISESYNDMVTIVQGWWKTLQNTTK